MGLPQLADDPGVIGRPQERRRLVCRIIADDIDIRDGKRALEEDEVEALAERRWLIAQIGILTARRSWIAQEPRRPCIRKARVDEIADAIVIASPGLTLIAQTLAALAALAVRHLRPGRSQAAPQPASTRSLTPS